MFRHYSLTRTSILSVSFTMAFGIAAYSFNFVNNDKVVFTLIALEVLLMVIAILAASRISAVVEELRSRLISIESGGDMRLHRAIGNVWLSGNLNFDYLGRLFAFVVIFFNFCLISLHVFLL